MTLKYLILSSDGEALIPGAGSTNQWDYKRKKISSKKMIALFTTSYNFRIPKNLSEGSKGVVEIEPNTSYKNKAMNTNTSHNWIARIPGSLRRR